MYVSSPTKLHTQTKFFFFHFLSCSVNCLLNLLCLRLRQVHIDLLRGFKLKHFDLFGVQRPDHVPGVQDLHLVSFDVLRHEPPASRDLLARPVHLNKAAHLPRHLFRLLVL